MYWKFNHKDTPYTMCYGEYLENFMGKWTRYIEPIFDQNKDIFLQEIALLKWSL